MKPAPTLTSPKKPYYDPKLIVYGNLAEITRTANNMGMSKDTIINGNKT